MVGSVAVRMRESPPEPWQDWECDMGIWTPGPGPTAGDDTFTGDATSEIANGGGGNDTLNGGGGNDQIDGGDGNDTLDGGFGLDVVYGGAGDDVLINSSYIGAGETLDGGDGLDTILVTGGFLVAGTPYRPVTEYFFTDLGAATLNSIERIKFESTKSTFVNFNMAQLGTSVPNTLIIEGDGQANAVQFQAMVAGTYSLADTTFQLVNWDQGVSEVSPRPDRSCAGLDLARSPHRHD